MHWHWCKTHSACNLFRQWFGSGGRKGMQVAGGELCLTSSTRPRVTPSRWTSRCNWKSVHPPVGRFPRQAKSATWLCETSRMNDIFVYCMSIYIYTFLYGLCSHINIQVLNIWCTYIGIQYSGEVNTLLVLLFIIVRLVIIGCKVMLDSKAVGAESCALETLVWPITHKLTTPPIPGCMDFFYVSGKA